MRVITDLSTLLGILLALGFVIAAIFMGESDPLAFLDVMSFFIVILGTLFLTIASFSFREIWKSKSLIFRTIFYHAEDPRDAATNAIEIAEIARKKGLLALQSFGELLNRSPFLSRGMQMIIDGMSQEEADALLRGEVIAMSERHKTGTSILRKAAEISPAMGLIGTLIGLVQMLANLNDPSSIGPAMAVALLTTLYGAMLAYMLFIPLASKLERNSRQEILVLGIYLEAIGSIARKENPRRLEMAINALLPPAYRVRYFN